MSRLSVVYEPKGRAREYAELAVNLYETCPHACTYCYVPGAMHKKPEAFKQPAVARKDIIGRLAQDCRQLRHDTRQVLFCFGCDPYPTHYHSMLDRVTTQALMLMRDHEIGVAVLTKGDTLAAMADMPLLQRPNCRFGVTLTHMHPTMYQKWEPGASRPSDRVAALSKAKSLGIPTWVSIEPVIDPEESLECIDYAAEYTDEFRLGKLNHHGAIERKVDWADYLLRATNRCIRHGVAYKIKDDLAEAARE